MAVRPSELTELQSCINGFLARQPGCGACDLDGDTDIDIVELQAVANCFVDPDLCRLREAPQ